METTLTQSTQDYLKNIFELTENGHPASTSDLAARLGVKPGSVTGMLQKLAAVEPPLVDYLKHQGATLTPEGEQAALEILRHHRLLEAWLVQSLGYTWDEVHEEACRLEHVISEDFEARVAATLGNPTRDPHGDPIPTVDLTMPADDSTSLASLQPSQSGTILRVNQEDPAFLRHLQSLGLVPGIKLDVIARSPFDDNLTIQVETTQEPIVIGPAISKHIFVDIN